MILDTSAILAIVLDEPERDDYLRRIGAAALVGVGGPTLAETSIVAGSRIPDGQRLVTLFIEGGGFEVIPFDARHWRVAAEAWVRFGKGRHPAALNLGDCLTYATARLAGRPLLAKGGDFAQTDLVLA